MTICKDYPYPEECKDKTSNHYFAFHMTQQEFKEMTKGHQTEFGSEIPFKFNLSEKSQEH